MAKQVPSVSEDDSTEESLAVDNFSEEADAVVEAEEVEVLAEPEPEPVPVLTPVTVANPARARSGMTVARSTRRP